VNANDDLGCFDGEAAPADRRWLPTEGQDYWMTMFPNSNSLDHFNLRASQPCPRPATVSLLGLDSGACIAGLVVDLGQGRPIVTFKWKHKLRHESGTPPALAAYGDVEPADVWIGGDRVGQATIMGILKAALADCDTEAAMGARWFLEVFRSALAAHRLQGEETACRQALAAALAGPALRLMNGMNSLSSTGRPPSPSACLN